ncbi:MAG: hypothetical protein D6807_02170, partial [Alphaproteobacteria bacterium]
PRDIQAKARAAVAHLEQWRAEGRDVSAILPRMRRVKTLGDAGRLAEADALLDEILAWFANEDGTATGLFGDDRVVRIVGYEGDAMEPFVSRDGRYLFFNSAGGPRSKDIFLAERIDDASFRFLGPLEGVNSDAVDGVPTMDRDGRFYFVSTRAYGPESLATVYGGRFTGGRVVDIRPHPELAQGEFGWLNMDVEISADGNTLYATQTWFGDGAPPTRSRFFHARREGDRFIPQADSKAIFGALNGTGIVYAAALSADETEIFFTRLAPAGKPGPRLATMRAVRPDRTAPFGPPEIVAAITGIAEAPTLGEGGRLLYYHKKKGPDGPFEIHVLSRRGD